MTDLPLNLIGSLESLQFDLYDRNVFYAIGSTNELFIEDEDNDAQVRVDKDSENIQEAGQRQAGKP